MRPVTQGLQESLVFWETPLVSPSISAGFPLLGIWFCSSFMITIMKSFSFFLLSLSTSFLSLLSRGWWGPELDNLGQESVETKALWPLLLSTTPETRQSRSGGEPCWSGPVASQSCLMKTCVQWSLVRGREPLVCGRFLAQPDRIEVSPSCPPGHGPALHNSTQLRFPSEFEGRPGSRVFRKEARTWTA